MSNEIIVKPLSGWVGILTTSLCLALGIVGIVFGYVATTALFGVALFMLVGSVIVSPNESCILILFGRYAGTIKKNGFFWINPLSNRKTVSLKPQNFNSIPIKANDIVGTPVVIGLVLVWKVEDTYKAAFEVDDYTRFVMFQCDAALLELVHQYPYDNTEMKTAECTLIAGGEVLNKHLEETLRIRLQNGGIGVIEARINYLAYGSKNPAGKHKKKPNGEKKDSGLRQ